MYGTGDNNRLNNVSSTSVVPEGSSMWFITITPNLPLDKLNIGNAYMRLKELATYLPRVLYNNWPDKNKNAMRIEVHNFDENDNNIGAFKSKGTNRQQKIPFVKSAHMKYLVGSKFHMHLVVEQKPQTKLIHFHLLLYAIKHDKSFRLFLDWNRLRNGLRSQANWLANTYIHVSNKNQHNLSINGILEANNVTGAINMNRATNYMKKEEFSQLDH